MNVRPINRDKYVFLISVLLADKVDAVDAVDAVDVVVVVIVVVVFEAVELCCVVSVT